MAIGTGIQIEQKQKTAVTSAQLQTVQILQMNSAELEERIRTELMENPVLEELTPLIETGELVDGGNIRDEKQADEDAYDDSDRWDGSWENSFIKVDGESPDYEKFVHREITLREHLLNQLAGIKCSDPVRQAAEIAIYYIDSNGYIEADCSEIANDHYIDAANVAYALELIRQFDPQGVGYLTLQECLKSQLKTDSILYDKTCKVIDFHLYEVARGDLKSIAKAVKVTRDEAKEICSVIRTLEPKPGMRYSDGESVAYITPDVRVEMIGEEPYIYMCGKQTHLGISDYYRNLYRSSDDEEVISYLRNKIRSAEQLINNIEIRRNTIISVTKAILKHQEHFLSPGNRVLLPLTMQEIADELGVNVSTVSRTVSGKFLMLGGGTYSLKYFFVTDIKGSTRDQIVEEIKSLISTEDPSKPLSDQKITELLQANGYEVSRRTVAKYREQEGILTKSMRKEKYTK